MIAYYRHVVVGPLEQRGFALHEVDVFLGSSNTQLPLSSECVHLAGSVIYVRGMSLRTSVLLYLSIDTCNCFLALS